MNYLFSNWNVFNIFNLSLLWDIFSGISSFWNVFSVGFLNWDLFNVWFLLWDIISDIRIGNLRNIFGLVFNDLIVSVLSGDWDLFNSLNSFIVSVLSLDWDVFSFGDLFIIDVFSLEWNLFILWFSSVWLSEGSSLLNNLNRCLLNKWSLLDILNWCLNKTWLLNNWNWSLSVLDLWC